MKKLLITLIRFTKKVRMLLRLIILTIMPLLCNAKIKINITVASNFEDTIVQFSGHDYKLITDKEITLFNLTDDNIKRGIRIELGEAPADVFLKDPTPYDNLFEMYKWPEVKRNLHIFEARVVDIFNENVEVEACDDINSTPTPINATVGILKNVENTVSSTWSSKGLPDDDIYYEVNINFLRKAFKYENKWRNGSSRYVVEPFGVIKEGYVKVNPGQTVTTKLMAVKTVLLIEVDYSAKIIGSFIANYAHTYGKYHFYAPSVFDIMKAAKLNNELTTTETLEIRCYTDPHLEVLDKLTGEAVHVIAPQKLFRSKNIKYYY